MVFENSSFARKFWFRVRIVGLLLLLMHSIDGKGRTFTVVRAVCRLDNIPFSLYDDFLTFSFAFLCYLSIKSRAFSQCNCWLSAAYPTMIMRRLLYSAFNLVSVKYFTLMVSLLLLLLFIVLSVWVMQSGKIKVIPQIRHLQNNNSLSQDGKCHLQAVLNCSLGSAKWNWECLRLLVVASS